MAAVTRIPACPLCGNPISAEEPEISEGFTACRACDKIFPTRDLIDKPVADQATLVAPPTGCSYTPTADGFVVRVSPRSLPAALLLLPLALIWNGFISIFMMVVVAAYWRYFSGHIPRWLPLSAGDSVPAHSRSDLKLAICFTVFLIPFIAVGLLLLRAALMKLAGTMEIMVAGNEGRIRMGIGRLRRTRRFDAAKVKWVAPGPAFSQQHEDDKPLIYIQAERIIKLGDIIPDRRRAWLLDALHLLLVEKVERLLHNAPPRRAEVLSYITLLAFDLVPGFEGERERERE